MDTPLRNFIDNFLRAFSCPITQMQLLRHIQQDRIEREKSVPAKDSERRVHLYIMLSNFYRK